MGGFNAGKRKNDVLGICFAEADRAYCKRVYLCRMGWGIREQKKRASPT